MKIGNEEEGKEVLLTTDIYKELSLHSKQWLAKCKFDRTRNKWIHRSMTLFEKEIHFCSCFSRRILLFKYGHDSHINVSMCHSCSHLLSRQWTNAANVTKGSLICDINRAFLETKNV